MFQRDHNPPHCHAFGTVFEAKFPIHELSVMETRGSVRASDDGRWLEWPGEVDICADDIWYQAHPETKVEGLELTWK